MGLIFDIWQRLSPSLSGVIAFCKLLIVFCALLIACGGVLLSLWLAYPKIAGLLREFFAKCRLRKRLPDYTPQQIERGIRYYIWPDCQSVDPAQSDEARHKVSTRENLRSTMDRLLTQTTAYKYYIILADTGMGKTSFLLNYFARHLRRWRKPVAMELIPFGVPNLQERLDRLKKILSPEKTVLLLDAFDVDDEAIQDHAKRLSEIMQWTRDFSRVVITCRTQFFPRDEEIPIETGFIKVGPRETGTIKLGPRGLEEDPQFTFYKIYLSPFSDEQLHAYLKRRFPLWRRSRRQKAQVMVDKIPDLAVRPVLLSYVDDLINSGKEFKNCYQIYTALVDAWLERELAFVKDKEALTGFSGKLAVQLFTNRVKGLSERIHYHEIEPMAKRFGIRLDDWQLTDRSLLNRDAEGNYKFAHRSIPEFLFAQRLLDGDQEALQIPTKYWTDQVKFFLFDRCGRIPWKLPFPLRFSILSVAFKGGIFQLGKTGKPGKPVKVKPFVMAIYPVTNREYEEFDPSHREKRDKYSDQDDQPVIYVSWENAVRFCQWLSENTGEHYRLPTEAEWEFAASGGGQRQYLWGGVQRQYPWGGGQRQYPWGNEDPSPRRTNYVKSKIGKTTPVGSYPLGRTPEGLFDMAGNVWEWCDDWFDEDEKERGRVVRGGSFGDDLLNLRCAARFGGLWDDFCGFRVVRGPSESMVMIHDHDSVDASRLRTAGQRGS